MSKTAMKISNSTKKSFYTWLYKMLWQMQFHIRWGRAKWRGKTESTQSAVEATILEEASEERSWSLASVFGNWRLTIGEAIPEASADDIRDMIDNEFPGFLNFWCPQRFFLKHRLKRCEKLNTDDLQQEKKIGYKNSQGGGVGGSKHECQNIGLSI